MSQHAVTNVALFACVGFALVANAYRIGRPGVVSAPDWLRARVHRRELERLLRKSPAQWPIVRRKAARVYVADVLDVRGKERVVQQKLQVGPPLTLLGAPRVTVGDLKELATS